METKHETQSNLPVHSNDDDNGKLRDGASSRPELRKGFKLAWSLAIEPGLDRLDTKS